VSFVESLVLASLLFSAPADGTAPAAPTAETPPEAPEVWTLETCLVYAFGLRSEVLESDAAITAAQAGVESARAGYIPSATLSAGYQRVEGGFSRATSAVGVNSFSLGLSASWTATDLAWVPIRIRVAQESAQSVEVAAEVTQRAIRLEVVVAYYVLWGAERVSELTRQTQAAAQTHREFAVAREEVGLGARADIARAEVEMADAAVAVSAADAAVETARAQLARAIGLPPAMRLAIVDDEPSPGAVPGAPPVAPERPELVVLERQQAAAEAAVEAAEEGYWPQVTVSASYGVQDDTFFPTQQAWSVGAALQVPLLSWGATVPAVDAAEARAAELRARIDTTTSDIELEIQNAWFALQEARARLEASGALIASAAENVRVAEGLYQAGTGSMIELVDARAAVLRAQMTRVGAVRDVAIAAARLRFAAGEEP
jgi:outer membrane protein TolC